MTGGGVTGTRGEMIDRGVIEGVGGGLESDIDKEKSLIKLKNDSESEQWGVGFNLLAVALLEVGKALWDRTCPLEDRAKLWEKVRLWVLTKMLGREHPSECDRTWLLEELNPWELDPEAKEHLRAEIRSLCEALGRLLTSTTNMAPVPEFKGPRMLPLVRRGVHWASYSSFTALEREGQRRLHQLLGDLSRRVSGELSSGAPGDLSSLEKELAQLKSQSEQQTLEVVARIQYTLDRKIPEPRAHIPPGGNQPLGRRTSKSGGGQSGDVEVGSSSRQGSLQQKQTVLNSALLDPVTPSEQFDGSLADLLSESPESSAGLLPSELQPTACLPCEPEPAACLPSEPEPPDCLHSEHEPSAHLPTKSESPAYLESEPELPACLASEPELPACLASEPELPASLPSAPERPGSLPSGLEPLSCLLVYPVLPVCQPSEVSASIHSETEPLASETQLSTFEPPGHGSPAYPLLKSPACCTQSGNAEERSRNRSGSLQQKQTDWKSCCPRFRDVEKGRTRSRNLRREQMVRKSGLRNNACFWKWTTVAFALLFLITLPVVICKCIAIFGPSAVPLRNDNGCYRTDWMPSMNKYFWNKEETDWDTSSRLCQEKNGTLAVLHEELQVSELLKEYGRRYPWVGLQKLEEEFQWLDGTSWNSTVFPLNGYGDCVYLRKDGFSVNECTMRRSSLCRRKPCD